MFVEASRDVPLALAAARLALDRALADGGLVAESRRAQAAGLAFLMRVGPQGVGVTKQVQVRVLPSRTVGDLVITALRWEATGRSGRLFPSLDANLILQERSPGTTVSIFGAYTPPLGRLGARVDMAARLTVAQRTVDALLAEIAAKLIELAPSG